MKEKAFAKKALYGGRSTYFSRTNRYMGEDQTFGRLVAGLSLDERMALLDKFKTQSTLSKAPLYDEKKEGSFDFLGDDYEHLPWFMILFYKLWGVFKGQSPKQLFDSQQVARIGKIINSQAPGLYDYRTDLLLPGMHEKLTELRDAARFFYRVLDRSINRDKEAFYAFLASLEMGAIHQQLAIQTDPDYVAAHNPDAREGELRQFAHTLLNDSLHIIGEKEKSLMYANVRSLSCLKALAAFLFDRLILSFSLQKNLQGSVCTGRFVKDLLSSLQDVLFSLKQPPPLALLESLFIFSLQNQQNELGPNMNSGMQQLLAQAENSLEKIRDFNRQVPLPLILRCVSRDMHLEPHDIGGGEDWFVIYRDYWKGQIDEKFDGYIRNRRYENLIDIFNSFFKNTPLDLLENVESPQNPEGFPIPNLYSLSCLKTFFQMAFVEDMNQYLNVILLEGIFYWKEQQALFTESYNDIIKVREVILQFENKIAPDGDYGKPYFSKSREGEGPSASASIKQRKRQAALADAVKEAGQIVSHTRRALLNMINILGEIVDGKKDAPVNISYISNRMPGFIKSISASIGQLQQLVQLLDTINAIEDGE
jgi:hypothetical protein